MWFGGTWMINMHVHSHKQSLCITVFQGHRCFYEVGKNLSFYITEAVM